MQSGFGKPYYFLSNFFVNLDKKGTNITEETKGIPVDYSSLTLFFFSSKVMENRLKNSSLPKRLKDTKYSLEKTMGQRNSFPATRIGNV